MCQAIRPEKWRSTMLVLTRKNQEAVVIGGAGFERLLKVIVLDIDRGSVNQH